jgi:nuclear pore complex protein Nup107
MREWLHDTAPSPHPPEAATGYWKFTNLRLQQAQRTGDRRDVEKLVKELDPDAVNRASGGKVLSADDAVSKRISSEPSFRLIFPAELREGSCSGVIWIHSGRAA